ncbi:hypothetical protein SK128_015196 [Halocaridina rubra]|uniref:Uncharacterized protein n=1 Tax=Halocaridina rubra TaxID=373956 RepID=A0AAN8XRV3_HALRR
MSDPGLIVGVTFLTLGGVMALYGTVLCMTTKGSLYNAEDVDAMVAATVLEEETKRKKEEALFEDIRYGDKSKKRKVLMA